MVDSTLGVDAPVVVAPEVPASPEPAQQTPTEPPVPPTPKTYSEQEHEEDVRRKTRAVERRVEKEMRERMRAEVERDFLRERTQPDKPQDSNAEPDAKAFENPRDYVRALVKWERQQERAVEQEQARGRERQGDDVRRINQTAATLEAKFADASKEYPDFHEVVIANEDAPMTYDMAEAISTSDVPVKLAYYLAHPDNLGHAQKIARMSGAHLGREIASLETKLKAAPATTQAPAPITPSGQKAVAQKDPLKMSDKEFAEHRRRQIAQR